MASHPQGDSKASHPQGDSKREYVPMTPEELARAEERLRHPAPGSRIEAAQKYGIDLTLLIEALRRTPAERVRKLASASKSIERIRGLAGQRR